MTISDGRGVRGFRGIAIFCLSCMTEQTDAISFNLTLFQRNEAP
jgi:hypothetical protein